MITTQDVDTIMFIKVRVAYRQDIYLPCRILTVTKSQVEIYFIGAAHKHGEITQWVAHNRLMHLKDLSVRLP